MCIYRIVPINDIKRAKFYIDLFPKNVKNVDFITDFVYIFFGYFSNKFKMVIVVVVLIPKERRRKKKHQKHQANDNLLEWLYDHIYQS